MSKKKIRKPKKRAPLKRTRHDVLSSMYQEDLLMKNAETGETINVSELIRNYDSLTQTSDLEYIYETYNNPRSPLYDQKKAEQVAKRMAELGDADRYVLKGEDLFFQGEEKKALPYLKKGVEVNHRVANYCYGLYLTHQNDAKKAVVYFEKASAQEVPQASYNAFVLYSTKDEIEDLKKAQYYLNIAFKQGHSQASEIVWTRNLFEPYDHIDEEIAIKGLEWEVDHHKESLLFKIEYTYITTHISDEKFFNLLKRITSDNRFYDKRLAECYLFGIGTKPNPQKALSYFKGLTNDKMIKSFVHHFDVNKPLESMMKAARSTKACCYYAAKMLMYGSYGEKDIEKAIAYLEKGLSNNYPVMKNTLAHIYLWDDHHRNYTIAREILESDQGFFFYGEDLLRLKDLYTIYTQGLGVEKNQEKAKKYADEIMLHAMFL